MTQEIDNPSSLDSEIMEPMNDLIFRLAEAEEIAAAATLRWKWVIVENEGNPVVAREEFVSTYTEWAAIHAETHSCYLALRGANIIGMAWLALLARVPSPRALTRKSADLQSVFILPEHRNAGIGGQLIAFVLEAATELGVERVSVHSSQDAITAYQRAGFAVSPRLMDITIAYPV
jgi:GNAT superfamily N-acetyltransferase